MSHFNLSPITTLDHTLTHRFYFVGSVLNEWVEGTIIKVSENGDYWVHRSNGRTSIIPRHAILRIDLEV